MQRPVRTAHTGTGRRGAALYLTTASISLLVAGMGLALIASQRADRRLQGNIALENQAWWCARAGLDVAMMYMEAVSDWRQRVTNDVLFEAMAVGGGTCTVLVYADGGELTDETEGVRIVSSGSVEGATFRWQARLLPRAHPALSFAAFGTSSQDMEFKSTAVVRGPVRSHGRIRAAAGVSCQGDASFTTLSGYDIESPLSPRTHVSTSIPAPSIDFGTYLAMATPISGTFGTICELKGYNLTPTSNPTGAANPHGVYALNSEGREVRVENIHIRGTLIIHNTGGKPVTFNKAAWIEPGPMSYPVLLVDGAELNLSMNESTLNESGVSLVIGLGGINLTVAASVDFNEDGDILDSFPTSIRGIVYSSGSRIRLNGGGWPLTGCVINQRIIVDDSVILDNDFQLLNAAAAGLVDRGMRIVRGSFTESP